MLIMSTASFPVSSAVDFAKKATEELTTNPYPGFTRRDYYFKFAGDEIVMYVIYDIEAGHEREAMFDINQRVFKFIQAIKGFKVEMEPVYGIEDAFSMMNMDTPPE